MCYNPLCVSVPPTAPLFHLIVSLSLPLFMLTQGVSPSTHPCPSLCLGSFQREGVMVGQGLALGGRGMETKSWPPWRPHLHLMEELKPLAQSSVNEIVHIKCWGQCRAQSKGSENGCANANLPGSVSELESTCCPMYRTSCTLGLARVCCLPRDSKGRVEHRSLWNQSGFHLCYVSCLWKVQSSERADLK